MPELEIFLDPENPQYADLVDGIQRNLSALETVEYRATKEQARPGTLHAGVAQVASFVVEHHDKIVEVAKFLIGATLQLLAYSRRKAEKREKRESPPVVIVLNGSKLELPASDKKVKEFLAAASTPKEGAAAVRKAKKSSKKRTRPKK